MNIPITTNLEKNLEKKIDLFLSLAKIKRKYPEVKLKILNHVKTAPGLYNYVLFRHSALYFFNADNIKFIEKTKDDYVGEYYLRFDGEKVSRIDPEYYLGALSKHSQDDWDTWFGAEFNTNNNNNNNNGNNNG